MYSYSIGYGSYEESEYSTLLHEELFSYDDITGMVGECIDLCLRNGHGYPHSYQDFHDDVIKLLCSVFDFKEEEYAVSWSVFGWASLFDERDWGRERGTVVDDLTDILRAKGYSRFTDRMHVSWSYQMLERLAPAYFGFNGIYKKRS